MYQLQCPCTVPLSLRVLAQIMELPFVVPVCPPGPLSVLARHLRIHGWIWAEDLLLTVVGHLADEGICQVRDLVCLEIDDVRQAATWPPEVRAHVQKIVCPWPVSVACLPVYACARCQAKCASRNMPQQRVPEMLRAPIASAVKRPKIERALDEVLSTPTLLLNVREARPLQAL
jgi:hypothetical protein